MDDRLRAVRELHFPDEYGYCPGDDFGGYEAESVTWPCTTAQTIYSAEEIAEITEAIRLRRKWVNENRPRLAASMLSRVLRRAYMDQIEFALRGTTMFQTLTTPVEFERRASL